MLTVKKHELNEKSTVRAAEVAKALGHPARIAILRILAQRDTCFCGDITELMPMAQSTVSQHLKALRLAGLIQGTTEGVRTCYCLNPEGIKELRNILNGLTEELASTCC